MSFGQLAKKKALIAQPIYVSAQSFEDQQSNHCVTFLNTVFEKRILFFKYVYPL